MKTVHLYLLGTLLLMALGACQKDLPTYLAFEGYEFASTDPNGGTWTPILISSGADIVIPAPADANSAQFEAEVADVKAQISQMTSTDTKAVTYWTQNPIVRWNEIALELVAKYNLIPGPNPRRVLHAAQPQRPRRPTRIPVCAPAVCGSRAGVFIGRAVRRADFGLAPQVCLQPPRALRERRIHSARLRGQPDSGLPFRRSRHRHRFQADTHTDVPLGSRVPGRKGG